MKKACEVADIKEADVYLDKREAALYGFNYFEHIRSCYKKTENDLYYNVKTKKRSRSYENDKWLSKKLYA